MAKVAQARQAGSLIESPDITPEELQLAVRNHSMPLEALRYAITPVGLHYLLIHFDIPTVDVADYELTVAGHVRTPLRFTLDQLAARPSTTLAVTLECAGNARARLSPTPMTPPWLADPARTPAMPGPP